MDFVGDSPKCGLYLKDCGESLKWLLVLIP